MWWLAKHRPARTRPSSARRMPRATPPRGRRRRERGGCRVKTFKGLDAVPEGFGPSAVTIGKFDGVHRGHRAVIDRIRSIAAADDLRAVVVTFDRNPLALLAPDKCPDALVSVRQKLELLATTGRRRDRAAAVRPGARVGARDRVRRARARRHPRCQGGARRPRLPLRRARRRRRRPAHRPRRDVRLHGRGRRRRAPRGRAPRVVDVDPRAPRRGRRAARDRAARPHARPCRASSCTARSAGASSGSRPRTSRPSPRG